jgi:hypothetical protein
MRSNLSRDDLKIEMLRFINGGERNIFDEYFERNFPALYKEVRTGGKSNALRLQNIEAEIINALGDWCASQNLFFISQNDGFMAKRCEADIIVEKLKNLVFKRFGYHPNIDIKDRFNTTDIKTPSPCESYAMLKDAKTSRFGRSIPDLAVKSPVLVKNRMAGRKRWKEAPLSLFAESANVERGDTL